METKYKADASHFLSIDKKFLSALLFFGFLGCLPFMTVSAQTVTNANHPPMTSGVVVKSIEEMEVPDILKNQARNEIVQMKSLGYVDAPEETISYIDKAIQTLNNNGKSPEADNNKEKELRPFQEIQPTLKVNPSLLLNFNEKIQMLGAAPGGALTPEGWSSLTRVFVIPKLGTLMLEENDYIASGGGLTMIEEAVNQDINGHPAIFRIKKSQDGKSVTELTWATDRKIYNLSLNEKVKGTALDDFISLAESIID
ncbi:hypothetical protein [Nitrosococcus oceani]|uniref:hypothetical protein n=1 Tax=Nitrosococcus oceani TaxID=1229 RepID=UPI0004E92076|nr:hypothetical protein [Nitrosococcus oceani]KFI22900.1 hypothetical protein HW44_06795 [Nitrosococcus oceani]